MSVIKPALQHPELIAYFSGANNYSWLYFRNGEKQLLAKPISYLEMQLPDFIRVHKTVLINPAYVKSLHQPPRQKMAGEIQLDSGEVFPVSRRRWPQVVEALQYRLTSSEKAEMIASAETVYAEPSNTGWQQQVTMLSVIIVTEDEQGTLLAKQTVAKKWPDYQLHIVQQSSHLPDLLKQLSRQNYPNLIFLDARTKMLERLNTLRRFKDDSQLNIIPVILFVAPKDQLVIDGYKHQANSVVSMSNESALFGQTFERICRFWLRTVALPGTGQ